MSHSSCSLVFVFLRLCFLIKIHKGSRDPTKRDVGFKKVRDDFIHRKYYIHFSTTKML